MKYLYKTSIYIHRPIFFLLKLTLYHQNKIKLTSRFQIIIYKILYIYIIYIDRIAFKIDRIEYVMYIHKQNKIVKKN